MTNTNDTPLTIDTVPAATAEEFWQLLSPETPLVPLPAELLFRGQADERWDLTPSIQRRLRPLTSDQQMFKEWAYLNTFVRHCDALGLQIPNDTPQFRAKYLNQGAPQGPAGAAINTGLRPPPELFELMALAQHYGVPTRLLDWSTRSHVAAYFAISDALSLPSGSTAERLAVWMLDKTKTNSFKALEILRVPGSNNANLAAQSGRFTLLRQQGSRGYPFEGETALDKLLSSEPLLATLKRVTLPIAEAYNALTLCNLYAVNGATMFPGYGGAARAARDDMSRTLW